MKKLNRLDIARDLALAKEIRKRLGDLDDVEKRSNNGVHQKDV